MARVFLNSCFMKAGFCALLIGLCLLYNERITRVDPLKGCANMARSRYQKLKPLYIMNYLLQHTDEEHTVSAGQSIGYLAAQGISCERKSLYDDIAALRLYGLDIVRTGFGKWAGYYIASRSFAMPEPKLPADRVQFPEHHTYESAFNFSTLHL